MKKFLLRYKIQIIVGILSLLFIVLFPLFIGDSASSANSFRSIFGQIVLICYLLYLILLFLSFVIIQSFKKSSNLKYVAHILSFLIAYSFLAWSFYAIAAGPFPMMG